MVELFGNNENPDQISRSVASSLGLRCSAISRFGVSRLQWVKPLPQLIILGQKDIKLVSILTVLWP